MLADDSSSQPEAPDVRALVDRARTGDTLAFGQLYDLYVESIYRYVLVRVRHPEDAEDITAEVFVKVMAALPRFQWRDVPFLAWVYRIAHNQVASHQRRGHSRPASAAIENLDFVDPGDGPDWLVEQKVTMEEVTAAIKQLPEAQRQVIELRFAAGLSVRETAQALNKNENNVKVLQFKAIERLRRLLPHGEPPGQPQIKGKQKR